MSKRLGLSAAVVLALVLVSPIVRSQAPAKKPFVVRVDLVGRHIRYRVDGMPNEDLLRALALLHKRDANAQVIVLLDRRVPLDEIGNVDGTAGKAQLTNLRYFVVYYDTEKMAELTMGAGMRITTDPPAK
jgi:biopolymer transport protein ExbD